MNDMLLIKRHPLFLGLFLTLTVMACQKDKVIPPVSFTVGNTGYPMTVQVIDTQLFHWDALRLDLNQDGENDIEFSIGSTWVGPSGDGGEVIHLGIIPLNTNLAFFGYYDTDTIYMKKTIFSTTVENDGSYTIERGLTYACRPDNAAFKIHEIKTNVFNIMPFNAGDAIDKSYAMVNQMLTYSSPQFNPCSHTIFEHTVADTNFLDCISNYNDCHDSPFNNGGYLVFKFLDSGKMGWIHLKIFNPLKMHIYASGIEQ